MNRVDFITKDLGVKLQKMVNKLSGIFKEKKKQTKLEYEQNIRIKLLQEQVCKLESRMSELQMRYYRHIYFPYLPIPEFSNTELLGVGRQGNRFYIRSSLSIREEMNVSNYGRSIIHNDLYNELYDSIVYNPRAVERIEIYDDPITMNTDSEITTVERIEQ